MLKGLIVLLMIALLITLGAGLYFLMIDQGDVKKTRLVNSLRCLLYTSDAADE